MNRALTKFADFTLSFTVVVALAAMVVWVAGHMATPGY